MKKSKFLSTLFLTVGLLLNNSCDLEYKCRQRHHPYDNCKTCSQQTSPHQPSLNRCNNITACIEATHESVSEFIEALREKCIEQGCEFPDYNFHSWGGHGTVVNGEWVQELPQSRLVYQSTLLDSWGGRRGGWHEELQFYPYLPWTIHDMIYHNLNGGMFLPCLTNAERQKSREVGLKKADEIHGIFQ